MQKYYVSPKPTSPEIHFSPEENIFLLRGISSPEDVRTTYYPVIEWINTFTTTLIEGKDKKYSSAFPVKLQIDLEYFNSSSAKFIFDIIADFHKITSAGIPLIVEWYYDEEDTDMQEAGADIATLIGVEFIYKIK
jgi:hypothetical protein